VTFTDTDAEAIYSVPVPEGVESAYVAYAGGSTVEIYDIWLE
jgi:hypothetical protein